MPSTDEFFTNDNFRGHFIEVEASTQHMLLILYSYEGCEHPKRLQNVPQDVPPNVSS